LESLWLPFAIHWFLFARRLLWCRGVAAGLSPIQHGKRKLLFLFDNFALDCSRRELRQSGDLVSVAPKVFDLLAHLIRNRERVVSRDDLIVAVWDGRIISESALATCINAARAAIADSGEEQRLIKTLPRKGIRFVGEVRDGSAATPPSATAETFSLPSKPSIAVLPFQNMSDDAEQEYFADGVVEDIITGLSRIKSLFVIARNSAFAYKGAAVNVKQIGRDLGVRYVLEGGVRRVGNRVRLTVQLVEAETGIQLWAERYDRLLEDIFALQDEITISVVGAIEPNVRKAEIERVRRKRPENLDAYDFLLRALPYVYTHTATDAATALPLLEKALKSDPSYAAAHALMAWCYHFRYSRGGLREQDRAAAVEHAHAAISLGADDPTSLAIAAFVISLDEHDQTTALDVFERALSISSSDVFALSCSALILSWIGEPDKAIERADTALRLSPFDSLNYLSYNAIAIARFHQCKYKEAHDAARRSVQSNPRFSVCHAFLAAALVRLGRDEEARAEAKRVLALDPSFSVRRFGVTVDITPDVFEPLADAWRAAGLPEQ
jgi:TolB-like protein/Tfp pilus assembly protein PilF